MHRSHVLHVLILIFVRTYRSASALNFVALPLFILFSLVLFNIRIISSHTYSDPLFTFYNPGILFAPLFFTHIQTPTKTHSFYSVRNSRIAKFFFPRTHSSVIYIYVFHCAYDYYYFEFFRKYLFSFQLSSH